MTQYDAVFIDPLPRNCTPLDTVTRWRHGFEVTVSTLGRCTVSPAVLTEGGVRADDPVLGTTLPGDLWLYATDGWLQWPGRPELTSPVPSAGLAFRPDNACSERGCTLVLAGLRARPTSPPGSTARPSPCRAPPTAGSRCRSRPTRPVPTCGSRSPGPPAVPLDVRLTGLSLVLTKGTA